MRNSKKTTLLRGTALAATLALFAGCASSPPTIDTSEQSEATYDGLYPVRGGSADQAWARPGADISQYTKIRLLSAGIEYRPGGDSRRSYSARTSADHYEVTETQKARLAEAMQKAFNDELAKSEHFTLVDENGPDVLLIEGGLLDVISMVPPDPVGRGEVYLRRVGEATLVLEIRDSITNATLARVVDRRAAEKIGGALLNASPVTNAAEVRRLAQTWARLLRTRLDEFAAPQE